MNAQLKPQVTPGLCCCHWDFQNWVRLSTDATCSVHGAAAEIDRQRATECREEARRDEAEFVGASNGAIQWED